MVREDNPYEDKIGNLTEDLAKTNDRFDRFDKRFDDVIMKQEENAGSLATRFDKLDEFMGAMMSTFGPKISPPRPRSTTFTEHEAPT